MNSGEKYDLRIYEEIQSISNRSAHWRVSMRSSSWRPPTDVYETEDALIIRVEIAGMKESDFEIALNDHILSIRGFRQDLPEQRAYHQMEIYFGEFFIDIHLPLPVEPQGVEAAYKNGFLWVTLPKSKPQKIKIED
jgi:HSP20 family protein